MVRGGFVQAFQGALIARLQRLHDLQQLGGGLEIITGVTALVQEHHQVVPTLAQDGFRGVDSGCHEGPEGAGGQGPGKARPKKDGGQEPLLARLGPGFEVQAQFRGEPAVEFFQQFRNYFHIRAFVRFKVIVIIAEK